MEKKRHLTQTITWRPIGNTCNLLPGADEEILIYCGWLDDVVKGALEYPDAWQPGDDPHKLLWIDMTSGMELRDPQFWTELPFPGLLGAHATQSPFVGGA